MLDVCYVSVWLIYLPLRFVLGKPLAPMKERLRCSISVQGGYRFTIHPVWFHAVSVGEVRVVEPLIKRVRAHRPHQPGVVSTVTPTGYVLAKYLFRDPFIRIIYAPFDFTQVVKHFCDRIQPSVYIMAETEIWPNLICELSTRRVPVILINGRLSATSFRRYKRFRVIINKIIKKYDLLCVQNDKVKCRFLALGANKGTLSVVGNLKFEAAQIESRFTRTELGFTADDVIWIYGSIHAGEERPLLDIYAQAVKSRPQLGLMVAPRHVERAEAIVNVLKSYGLQAIRLSEMTTTNTGYPLNTKIPSQPSIVSSPLSRDLSLIQIF
jgi:3-deoxy-D-manno-octulosonic-acid transferase